MKYELPPKLIGENATVKVVWHYLNQFDKWVSFSIRDLEKAIGLNAVTINNAIKILRRKNIIFYKSKHEVGTSTPGIFTVKEIPSEEITKQTIVMSEKFKSYTPIGMILYFLFLENGKLIMANQKEIAEKIGVSERGVHKAMKIFYQSNVVNKARRGKYKFSEE